MNAFGCVGRTTVAQDVIHDSWEDVEMLTPSEEDLDAMVEAGYDCHCKSWVLRPCCSQSLPGWRGQQLEGIDGMQS